MNRNLSNCLQFGDRGVSPKKLKNMNQSTYRRIHQKNQNFWNIEINFQFCKRQFTYLFNKKIMNFLKLLKK